MIIRIKPAKFSLPRGAVLFSIASVLYLLLMHFLTGLRPEHFLMISGMNILFYAGNGTRKFILGFAIFAIFGMLYDFMRAFPNYHYNSVDISGLYQLEKNLFGISYKGMILTPNEYLSATHTVAGDIISGFFYINWVPVPLAFAVYLWLINRKLFLHFSLTFLFVNVIGFCIYYIHPAAPPWYVSLHGYSFIPGTPGSAADLARFDQLIGMDLFGSIYTKNANVFAALPSLHCAYPVIVLYYAFRVKPRWLVIPLGIFMFGIWFAAVYSGHHYVMDVILGILLAITGLFLYEKILLKLKSYTRFANEYLDLIS